MTDVWSKIETLAKHFESRFNETGEIIEGTLNTDYNWHNSLWTSAAYRRAHVEIVDHRESHKVYILHCTIFPHYNDPSPIWGFDAVCGPNKITGAFHDFSSAGDPTHPMMKEFEKLAAKYQWNKPRELPDWAKAIFSKNMVAAGNVSTDIEIDSLCNLAAHSLDYYLSEIGRTQESLFDFHMAQNRYCHYQKQNPHVVRSMVSMGIPEAKITKFVEEVLFPEFV
jgi:hypothetical protein